MNFFNIIGRWSPWPRNDRKQFVSHGAKQKSEKVIKDLSQGWLSVWPYNRIICHPSPVEVFRTIFKMVKEYIFID